MVNPLFWAGQQILTSGYFDMWYSDANLRSWMRNQRNPSNNESPQPSEEHLAVPCAFLETESEQELSSDRVQGLTGRHGQVGTACSPQPGACGRNRWCPHIAVLRLVIKQQQQFLLGLAWGVAFLPGLALEGCAVGWQSLARDTFCQTLALGRVEATATPWWRRIHIALCHEDCLLPVLPLRSWAPASWGKSSALEVKVKVWERGDSQSPVCLPVRHRRGPAAPRSEWVSECMCVPVRCWFPRRF